MNKLVEILLLYITLPVILVLAGIYLGGEVWAKGKIVLGDILKIFGWVNKGVRKLSIKSEYEGTLNSIIHDYNKNFEDPIMPNCKIEWVTSDNQRNIFNENENQAIVCLSFDKKDHNLNFYNATLHFVQTALIAKVKDYLIKPSSNAIDLLTTHIILRNNRKEVLTTFRKKLNEFDNDTKVEFENLIPTNERGLFLSMLLPEFHFYGELINTLPPHSEYGIEANSFLSWFKDLATREFDEKTSLKYISKNFKVGVILVGKDETWETQGKEAYTKWADYYASENFNSVYVLARGYNGYERATIVVNDLVSYKGFDQLNKNAKIKCASAEGKEYIVTCYSLRPNKASISYLAWENLKKYHLEKKDIPAIIDSVQKENIIINAFGLKFEIPNKLLSEIEINDSRKVFHSEDEIYLTIVEIDNDQQHIVLSNKGTISDPKNYIEAVLNENKVYPCIVERIQTDKQGLQTGLMVSNAELKSWVYIPTCRATYSRFLDLSLKYPLKTAVNIVIEKYNPTTSNFIGEVENRINPWGTDIVNKLQPRDIINVTVKQINEFSVICELSEGVECRFARQEISWAIEECNTSKFKIDDNIEVCIISIDVDRKHIDVSIKRLSKTPELEYYDIHADKSVEIEVAYVVPEKGIAVNYLGSTNTGFIWWSEIGWGSVGKFENLFKKGDKIKAIVSGFDAEKNSIKFSIKRQFKHQFKQWITFISDNELVEGTVIGYFENSVHIELSNKGITVQAFIFRKNISNFAFVEYNDLPYYLPIGEIFHFYISEINEERETISLTRLDYLEQIEYPNYGEKIEVQYVKENHSKGYLYSDELEGWINLPDDDIQLGSTIDVMLISSSTGEFTIIES